MSGNPVRFGDGCATVTGYKLPKPLAARAAREGGSEVSGPKSGYRFGCARPGRKRKTATCWLSGAFTANFSVKEKDEASPLRECVMGFAECLHSPICRGLKVFLFRGEVTGLRREIAPAGSSLPCPTGSALVSQP